MANAKQCDICGKFYAAHKVDRRCRDYYGDTNVIRLFDLGSDINRPNEKEPVSTEYETCPECFGKVVEFINSLKNEIDI